LTPKISIDLKQPVLKPREAAEEQTSSPDLLFIFLDRKSRMPDSLKRIGINSSNPDIQKYRGFWNLRFAHGASKFRTFFLLSRKQKPQKPPGFC